MRNTGRSRGLYLLITGTAVRAGSYIVHLLLHFTHQGRSSFRSHPASALLWSRGRLQLQVRVAAD